MDRKIIYPGQIPMVEDQLQAARFTQISVGRLAGALYDESGTGASGLACTPGSGLSVTISPGQITQPGTIDATAFGVLPASASALPRQYILADPVNIAIPGAGATYVVYGTPGTTDTANAVLPYYNSANPAQTFAGTSNSGQTQPTVRTDAVTIGIAASVPGGSIPLWSIVVPSGATAITSAMISAASGAPLYPSLRRLAMRIVAPFNAALAAAFGGYPSKTIVADPTTTGLFWVSTADNNLITPGESGASWVNLFAGLATETYAAQFNPGRYLNTTVITSSQTYTVPAGVYKIRVRLQAAGGAAGGSADNTGGNGSSCASSGGAGAYVEAIFPVTPGQQIPISIGVGGVGVTGKAGGTGGATTFGPFGSFAALSCPGGLGGYAGTQTSSSAASSIPGCPGNGPPSGPNIVYAVAAAGGLPGVAVLGTAAAPPGSNSPMGAGGAGITGYNGSTSQPGGNAGGWGGGGGAHANQQAAQNAGGAGANGIALIDEFSA